MPFDLSTARPVGGGGFDLSTAKPVTAADVPDDQGMFETVARYASLATPAGVVSKLLSEQGRRDLGNYTAGGARGAGSIGATLMWPIDKLKDTLRGDRGPNVTSLVTGKQPLSRNEERRQAMTEGLQMMGADPNSGMFQAGKLSAEAGGTAGAGQAVAGSLRAIPALTQAAQSSPAIARILTAIETGGASVGPQAAQATGSSLLPRLAAGASNMGARMIGGGVNGLATAGLVNPADAPAGGAMGALTPAALSGLGNFWQAAGSQMRGAGPGSPEAAAALRSAQERGYVIPPTQANPSLFNRALEGLAGKVSVAQQAATKNQSVTNNLAAKALGLPEGTTLTPELLDQLRAQAGKAYGNVSKLGAVNVIGKELPAGLKVTESGSSLLNNQSKTADMGDLVQAWRQYSADATAYFRSYGRTADPEALNKAMAAAGAKKQIDELLMSSIPKLQEKIPGKLIADLSSGKITQDQFLQQTMALVGKGDMAEALKAARMQIAKSHTVENAMNAVTGTVDARKLASELQKGKPLSGELKAAAEFAARYPKAAQVPEMMGSLPGVSPLDFATAGGISVGAGSPWGLLSMGARPAARSLALSPIIQRGLLGPTPKAVSPRGLLDGPAFAGLLAARSAPLLASDL